MRPTIRILALGLLAASAAAAHADEWPAAVDSDALNTIALAHRGRLMILDTRARQLLQRICGREQLGDEAPAATVLDLIARPEARKRPLLYVNYLPLKRKLLKRLPGDRQEALLPRKVLLRVGQIQLASVMKDVAGGGDRKMLEALFELTEALDLLDPTRLQAELVMVPPAGSGSKQWTAPHEGQLGALLDAFRRKHAADVDAAAGVLLEDLIRRDRAGVYPTGWIRTLELLYNRLGKVTWVFAAYLTAAVVFLAAGLFRAKRVGVCGRLVLAVALLGHAGIMTVRSLIAGYLPLTNMYESLLLAALVVAGVVLVISCRKKAGPLPVWTIGAAGAFVAAILCLLTNFVGIGQGRIGAQTAILRSAWLTYHVMTIMIGYAFILLSFVVSIVYLLMRLRRGSAEIRPVDRANVILVRLAFLFVLAGILTGSVWADVAWGRWWGWDAKETMSLVTLLLFTVLLHARLFVRDKGRITAILSIVGVVSMIMTWFGVNYLISGSLHSYV